MKYRIGERQLVVGSRYLTLELRAGNDLLDDPDALRHAWRRTGICCSGACTTRPR
jgi:hypothetical protein